MSKFLLSSFRLFLARGVANGEEACKKLAEEGYTARYVEGDLTKPATFIALKDKLLREHGGIDVLINNAAFACQVNNT